MKYLNYTMSLFKKAIKRNNPKSIHLVERIVEGCNVYEYWFVTQKAVLSFATVVKREVQIFSDYLSSLDYCVKEFGYKHLEFIKYE